uniref:EF-hand domain-containing protein n=1 Tax=Timema cristinae TaxID=61476 RepID=A0A7R9CGY3_TIMCR|nr:unnamed protein product [Timema cristinae]
MADSYQSSSAPLLIWRYTDRRHCKDHFLEFRGYDTSTSINISGSIRPGREGGLHSSAFTTQRSHGTREIQRWRSFSDKLWHSIEKLSNKENSTSFHSNEIFRDRKCYSTLSVSSVYPEHRLPGSRIVCLVCVSGNGYIEGTELDGFLREFVSSANATDVGPEAVSDAMLVELKQCFMEAYDDNQDGKIDIRELAQLLPMEENFLLLFRFDNPLESSVEFMKIWREYDLDGSGYIEADELKNFLRDLLKEAKKINDVSEDKLIEYTDTMLQVFDANKDGRLQLSEMAKLLPVKENFLCRQIFKGATKLTKDDIERVFSLYDRDNNGTIENEELRGFLKDLLELVKKDYDAQDLADFEETILRGVDYNQDGKINKKELTMILLALAKHNLEEEHPSA